VAANLAPKPMSVNIFLLTLYQERKDMGKFKPVVGLRDQIKVAFLNGDIIKKDMGASTYMFIIPREHKNEWEVKGVQVSNISESRIPGVIKVPAADISDIISELEKDGYTVLSENVYSGCCQYHTEIYYLAGE
jgi:hypothetical protein